MVHISMMHLSMMLVYIMCVSMMHISLKHVSRIHIFMYPQCRYPDIIKGDCFYRGMIASECPVSCKTTFMEMGRVCDSYDNSIELWILPMVQDDGIQLWYLLVRGFFSSLGKLHYFSFPSDLGLVWVW